MRTQWCKLGCLFLVSSFLCICNSLKSCFSDQTTVRSCGNDGESCQSPLVCQVGDLSHFSLALFTSSNVLCLLNLWHRMPLLKMLCYCGPRLSIDYVVQVDSQPVSKGSGQHLQVRSSVVCAFEHGASAVAIISSTMA